MKNFLKDRILSSPSKMITYAEFIAVALYHPQLGYYMKDGEKIGRLGDFITSSNISDIYGRAFAKWYGHLVKTFHLPSAVCEIGAGNGRFAQAFLEEWNMSIRLPLTYSIVESSLFHRRLQQERIIFNESIHQVASLEEIGTFSGMVFSNELFDALPVHVIEKTDGNLMEVMVTVAGGELAENSVPLTNENICRFLQEYDLDLREGQRMEIPLEMEAMIARISETLKQGIVVTADYGYSKDEWMNPARRKGSLRAYWKHRMITNVLTNPGEMDITGHVHFDALIKQGEDKGLQFISKQRQDEFLLAAGILDELKEHHDPDPFSAAGKRNRAIRSLIMPGGMSPAFHVIIQQKGLNLQPHQLVKYRQEQ